MEESIKTLRKMLESCEQRLENCERVVERLATEMELFESREGYNTYVVRLSADHQSEARILRKEISALRLAIEYIEVDVLK